MGYTILSSISELYPGTPSLRDIIFHTQWCAALAMVAVQWPTFICMLIDFYRLEYVTDVMLDPILSQTAWATLSYSEFRCRASKSDANRL